MPVSWGEALAAAADGIAAAGAGGPARSPSSAAPASPTRTPTPGPSWPRASSAPTRSTPSWATASRPSWCSACRGPRSTRPASAPRARHAGRRPARGAAGPLPAPARGRARRASRRSIELAPDADRAHAAAPPPRWPSGPATRPLVARALAGDDAAAGALRPHPEGAALADGDARRGPRAAGRAPADGEGVVVVLGRPSLAESGEVVAEAAPRAWPRRCPRRTFLPALRRGNVLGALDMGLAPGLLPGPGRASTPGREWFTGGLGLGARAGRGSTPPASWPPWPASGGRRRRTPCGPSCCSVPTRSSDFPDRALAEAALVGRPTSSSP